MCTSLIRKICAIGVAAMFAASACTAPAPSATQSVLDACDLALQSHAMRAAHTPDWATLGLSACYDLTLELRPDESAYSGLARVTFANLTGGELTDVVFRTYPNAPVIYGGALDFTSARIDGEPATPEVFLADRTAVRLTLPHPLADQNALVVELNFEGRLPRNLSAEATYGIFNYSTPEPLITLSNWYPILAARRDGVWDAAEVLPEGDAVVSEAELYRVKVAAPADWKIVTTGSAVDSTPGEFVAGPVRDFTIVASPALEARESIVDDVRVRHWGLASGRSNWGAALEIAGSAVRTYDARFGPYPYAELDIVAAPLRNALGVEYPGLVLIGDDLYSSASAATTLPTTVAHEVAHQWWYAVVGNDVLREPWQDEGLTTFSSMLYFEEESPAFYAGLTGHYRQVYNDYVRVAGDEPIAQPVEAFKGRGRAYGAIVYGKAALFFLALRERVGDEAFFEALRAYYAGNKYRIAPVDALLGAFETACNCVLDDLYAEWGATPLKP